MNAPKFTIKHIGINTPSESEANALITFLCDLFALQRGDENDSHIFAGSLFEVMKNETIGKNGHIALQTEDVEAAIRYFAQKGISIREETVRRRDGKIIFAYLNLELGGFDVHLTC